MTLGNTATAYGPVARVLHWLAALLILTAFPLGLIAEAMPYATSEEFAAKAAMFSLHKTVGVAAFCVALLRIGWAVVQPRPLPVQAGPRGQLLLAAVVHWALYVSLIAVPLSGWVHHAATVGYAPILWPFGQDLPFVPKDAGVAAAAAALHGVFVWMLAAAVVLHVAGALKHALIDRDGTLARMLTGRPAAAAGARHPGRLAPLLAAGLYAAGAGVALSLLPATPVAAPAAAPVAAAPGAWRVETGTLRIAVTQLGQPVRGSFGDWTAAIAFDPASGTGQVRVEIGVGSLSFGALTAHVLDAEFLDARGHPLAVFEAAIRPAAEAAEAHVAEGTLRLRGAVVPVVLPFTLTLAGDRAEMAGEVTLDRRDFGVGAGQTDDRTLGFAVTVTVALTAVRVE
jgi:cytochrome b561/polyisoprenoid-binding protein YceI